jgi:hypothetical protein
MDDNENQFVVDDVSKIIKVNLFTNFAEILGIREVLWDLLALLLVDDRQDSSIYSLFIVGLRETVHFKKMLPDVLVYL